ncbi:MAG: glycoside hydrolase family 15 protein [Candidatus Woesearchaeota archaeon]
MEVCKLVDASKKVFLDCSLANGAIVAANSDNPNYPKDVQDYRYVWPRDAGFVCVAANALGLRQIQEPFFYWIMERAEEFSQSGLLYQNYYVNGPKRWLSYQPDQAGTLIWAVHDFCKDDKGLQQKYANLVVKLADGICNVWNKNHFSIITQDLWEGSYTYPEIENTHTYSLAACCHGLELAQSICSNARWQEVAVQMRHKIGSSFHKHYCRNHGKLCDRIVDASLLGLAYPFRICKPLDKEVVDTAAMIKEKLLIRKGVMRYELDLYDSYRLSGVNARRGAGAWPILTFWLSIYHSIAGDKELARSLFELGVKGSEGCLFPEQVFENSLQRSIRPLAWSHAMFVLAARELNL